jgi:hypothetical protein
MRAFISIVCLSLLVGCAHERSWKEPEQKPGIFETPDVDSLH